MTKAVGNAALATLILFIDLRFLSFQFAVYPRIKQDDLNSLTDLSQNADKHTSVKNLAFL